MTGPQGNHGEDVKECYYYLDGTPTHSYMRALYRYPQRAFPYAELRAENARRSRVDPEWELLDSGIFADQRYFDVIVEYAKASPTDICIRISATNHGPEPAPLHICRPCGSATPGRGVATQRGQSLRAVPGESCLEAQHPTLGTYWLSWQADPRLLFTENETNRDRLWQRAQPHALHQGRHQLCRGGGPRRSGESGPRRHAHGSGLPLPHPTRRDRERVAAAFGRAPGNAIRHGFSGLCRSAGARPTQFYAQMPGAQELSEDERQRAASGVRRPAVAKQVYIWDLPQWMSGDPAEPPPPAERSHGRNSGWAHFNTTHVLSVPDAWEYPWFAAWDLAFHCIPLAYVDPEFAKDQLTIMLREWYMHPNGQIPAYEWSFDDVNPPVHAWARGACTRSIVS